MRTTSWPLVLILLVLPLTACDSDGVSVNTDNVIGTYDFTQFRFEPAADPGVLVPANILDTLVVAETSLRFAANGQFLLEYQFQGAPDDPIFVSGEYGGTESGVTLVVADGFGDEREQLLLPQEFVLAVLDDGERLQASIDQDDVLLSTFSDRYAGIGRADGTLLISLQKR